MSEENEKINGQGDAQITEDKVEDIKTQEIAREELADTEEKEPRRSKHSHKLEAALAAAEKERDDFKDKYLRTFSDFNNYKKRNMTAVAAANREGQAEAVARILPILDSFERALEPMEGQQEDAFVKGMFMVYRQLSDAVAALGVKEIAAKGETFDPNVHQAISMEDAAEGQQAGVVTNVLRKGYLLDDKVLRHCMVTVSK